MKTTKEQTIKREEAEKWINGVEAQAKVRAEQAAEGARNERFNWDVQYASSKSVMERSSCREKPE